MVAVMRWRLAAIGMWLGGTTLGCGEDCNSESVVPGYRIVVYEAGSSTPVCDASVYVNELSARETADCAYAADVPAGEAATLKVEKAGYATATQQVTTKYETDSCGKAITIQVQVQLEPNP